MRITLYESTAEKGKHVQRLMLDGDYDEIYRFQHEHGFTEETEGVFKKETPFK